LKALMTGRRKDIESNSDLAWLAARPLARSPHHREQRRLQAIGDELDRAEAPRLIN
jgi:hypothetical protein